ncbi:MAG: T9SS type A sorting domain-containing protein [Bacteroidaceae bacterium]|nr:T9SS type A sorting domain-containing protein [Bacteroidaceae bacterium]MBR1789806.1 T9SS type A sorting domain-containing protein [Bacteroidaceae bacterium]
MIKGLQIIALSLLLAAVPVSLMAETERDDVETELTAVTLSVNGSRVHIAGAEGETLEVYNLTGVKVATIRIDSNDKNVLLNLQRGCYILKVGKVVRKISIR